MKIWMFELFCDLIIPCMMLVMGLYYLKRPPKTINWLHGYRTRRSMKNQETWDFAHQYSGKLWFRCGSVMLLVTVLAMIYFYGYNENDVKTYGGAICAVQCLVMLAAMMPTERALKRKFGV